MIKRNNNETLHEYLNRKAKVKAQTNINIQKQKQTLVLNPTKDEFIKHRQLKAIHSITRDFLPEPRDLSQYKLLVETAGATVCNSHRYIKMFKEVNKRYHYLNKVEAHHLSKGTLCHDLNYQIELHKEIVNSVLRTLDINNTIDQHDSAITEWSKYMVENPAVLLDEELKMPPKQKKFADEATKQLLIVQNKSRAAYAKQRIHNAMQEAHKKGWFVVFDTLTLAPDKVEAFYNDKNAIRDYTRRIGRDVLEALGLPRSSKYTDHYQYICVPEYGTKNGRLHFHLVHLLEKLPLKQLDPNFGRPSKARDKRELVTFKHWNYCDPWLHKPICVRYSGDAYNTHLNWLMPIDKATGKPIELKPMLAVAHYIAKYINKSVEQDSIKKDLIGGNKWNQQLKKTLNNLPTHTWRIRMSRGFGMNTPPMDSLSNEVLAELTKLHWSVTPFNKILKRNALKEMKKRITSLRVVDLPKLLPNVPNLLKSLRDSMNGTLPFNQQSSTNIMMENLMLTGISKYTYNWLDAFGLIRDPTKIQSKVTLGSK